MSTSITFPIKVPKFELRTNLQPLPAGYPISASVVLDSVNAYTGSRLTTLELLFPRYILAEFNTHRVFSRNTSSSRAIPTSKQIKSILESPVLPCRFGKNQPGMQPSQENLTGEDLEEAVRIWNSMVEFVAAGCLRLSELGLHKQWASRPLEWASTTKLVVTSTDFTNFFTLRDHEGAQDEIAHLAQAIKIALNESTPVVKTYGDWHLPYVTDEELKTLGIRNSLKVSASRCARTSYKTQHGVTSTLEEDIKMFDRLTFNMQFSEGSPFHASPTEHQATPSLSPDPKNRNFKDWAQLRGVIEGGEFDRF